MLRSRPLRLLPVLFLLAGCASTAPPPQSTPGAPAAPAAVERFLQAAAAKDYVEMGWSFGTHEGSIFRRDPPADVERRMYALATVLQHDAVEIRDQAPVAGRTGDAVRLLVRLNNAGRRYDVPFTAVRGPEGRWFVEQVDVEAVTGKS